MKPAALVCLLLFGVIVTNDDASPSTSSEAISLLAAPDHLRCEYLENPVGIDQVKPRLSWQDMAALAASRSVTQSAYQILVASTPELLAKDQGDLWNSARVVSNQSVLVEYAGAALTSHKACYWKIRVWDQKGRPSAWSSSALWSMGLLDPKEWTAQWIGRDDAKPEVPPDGQKIYFPATYLRKDFFLTKTPRRAILYITSEGVVEPWLNNEKVGDDFFTPGWTDYNKRLYYRSYLVTDRIKAGANTLGAIVGDGWFRGNLSIRGQNLYGKTTRLLAQLHLFFSDGSSEVITSDESWKAAFGPILASDIQAGETYDARLEMPGWSAPGFNDSGWAGVTTGSNLHPALMAYPEAPVQRRGEIVPVEIRETPSRLHVFNFGQNFSGWVRLKVTAPAGTKIVMRFGEMKNPDGTVYQTNLRSARATDTYICKGTGEEIWEPRFTYHGFQYVEVEGLPNAPPKPQTLTGIIVHSSLPLLGEFECSNKQINRIRSNMLWSIRSNSFDIPTDCPQRDERMGWMDYHEIARSALYEIDSSSLFTKWMGDIVDAKLGEGIYSQMAPDIHLFPWSPCWADSVFLIPWTVYQVNGDKRLLERYYGDMASHLAHYQKVSTDFIGPDEGYGDWLALEPTPKDLISTALFAYETGAMSVIAGALGKTEDSTKYRNLYDKIRTAFRARFVHSDGTIGNNSQGSYAYAIAYNLLSDSEEERAGNDLVKAIEAHQGHMVTGMPATHLVLPALSMTGHTDVAYQLLEQKTYPSWGYSIGLGATTIWERWDSLTDKGFNPEAMNSYNHANLGTCTEWLYRTLLGIDLVDPGFQTILIKPEPGGDVTWAEGHYDSIHGRIETSWKIEDHRYHLEASIPANTRALVYIPTSSPDKVLESGSAIVKSRDIQFVRMDGRFSVFKIGSGSYRFTSPWAGD